MLCFIHKIKVKKQTIILQITQSNYGMQPPQLQFLKPTSPLGCFRMRLLKSCPSRTRKSLSGEIMPHLVAMDRAVFILSPVTIRTVMPACWHRLIASGTCNKQIKTNFCWAYKHAGKGQHDDRTIEYSQCYDVILHGRQIYHYALVLVN